MRWSKKYSFVFLSLLVPALVWLSTPPVVAQLAKGRCFKIGVTQTGIYKLDAAFLRKIGLDPTQIDPRNLHLHGNGGAMLPQPNAAPRPGSLTENAVFVKGEADGRFDANDALWFYGQSPHQILFDAENKLFTHQINYYSDTTFYFLSVDNSPGLRVESRPSVAADRTFSVYDDYVFDEKEQISKVSSGREWLGTFFGAQTSQNSDFELPNIVPNSNIIVTAAVVAAAQVATKFSFRVNDQLLGEQTMGTVSTFRYAIKGDRRVQKFERPVVIDGDRVRINTTFDKNGQGSAEGYLDFLGVQTKRQLRHGTQTMPFRSIESTGFDRAGFVVRSVSNDLIIWDVTDALRPRNQLYVSLPNQEVSFGFESKKLREFIGFTESQTLIPAVGYAIPNQNLRNLPTPNLLIVTAQKWRAEAQKLADFRQQNDGLEALVVSTQTIFNEFSSGKNDVSAIRDFAKFLFDKTPNKLKYLLLFGDATYDPKNNTKTQTAAQLADFVPVYQSRESLHPIFTYSSDDYFGFLKPQDGEWTEGFGDHTLDIGVGRLPAKTTEEAETLVQKLIQYRTSRSVGQWRNRLTFVADDGDGNYYPTDSEYLSDSVVAKANSAYNFNKIYVDAYPQIATPFQRAPAVNTAINRGINDGSLVVNYIGHGGESGWAEEQILGINDIFGWRNPNNLPLFVTATCEFGRYDNPALVSGAELTILSPRGGGVGLLTTTRPVFANTNFLVNAAFFETVFKPINGQMPRMGDVMRITKNNSLAGSLNRNFAFLGDPSMRLNYPNFQAVVTQINNKQTDTLRALSSVKIVGEIRNGKELVDTFNGFANVVIFDKQNVLTTLGNESSKMKYGSFQNRLFEGRVSVRSGRFECTFNVPKDIDYRFGKGRISIYAVQNDSLMDAAGSSDKIIVGGSLSKPLNTQPPVVEVFMNNNKFVDGMVLNQSPMFIAQISDDDGINTSQAGIGHSLMLTLNDTLALNMNDYFSANIDDFRAGTVRFQFDKLPEGNYKLAFKAWDTHNNSTEKSLRFSVQTEQIQITEMIVFPNPFTESANFKITQNRPGNDIEITLEIADLTGKIVASKKQTYYNANGTINDVSWSVPNILKTTNTFQTYVYRIVVRSITDNSSDIRTDKLLYSK